MVRGGGPRGRGFGFRGGAPRGGGFGSFKGGHPRPPFIPHVPFDMVLAEPAFPSVMKKVGSNTSKVTKFSLNYVKYLFLSVSKTLSGTLKYLIILFPKNLIQRETMMPYKQL